MLTEYIEAAMKTAKYERIEDEEPHYGSIERCKGVWATGKTLAECKRNLREVLEDWIFVRISKGVTVPEIAGRTIQPLVRVSHAQTQTTQVA